MQKKRTCTIFLVNVLLLSACFNVVGLDIKAKADYNYYYDEDDTFDLSYNKDDYTAYWITSKRVLCKCEYRCFWTDLDKGDRLGAATVKMCYLHPKRKKGSNYYGIACCKISMDPKDIKGNISGMSQFVKIGIKTINSDSRVCFPTNDMLDVQVTKGKNSQNGVTFNIGAAFNGNNKKWEPSSNFSFNHNWITSTSVTYNTNNVNLIQKTRNNSFCTWEYDYISHKGDIVWNAYLMSSSAVYGQVIF